MTPRPTVFISAVSRELGTARKLVADTLTSLGYTPLWQDVFGTEQGDLRAVLRRKIDECHGVVQLVGVRYGVEPPAPDAAFGRVSYTQYEALYAKSKGKKVWYLVVGPDFPRDAADPEPPEMAALQQAYRDGLGGHSLFHPVQTAAAMENSVLRLRDDLARLRRGVRRWAVGVSAVLLLLAVGVTWLVLRPAPPSDPVLDGYARLERQTGVRVRDLKASDLTVTVSPEVHESYMRVVVGVPPAYEPLLPYWNLRLRFNDGPSHDVYAFQSAMRLTLPTADTTSATVTLEANHQATHLLDRYGPFAVKPVAAPPMADVLELRRKNADRLDRTRADRVLNAVRSQPHHLQIADTGFASWLNVDENNVAVRRLLFGESPDRLDRVIEPPARQGEWSWRNQAASRYRYIAVREGAPLYSRLELSDGSQTAVCPAAPRRFGTPGAAVSGIEAVPDRGQPTTLRLFAAGGTDADASYTLTVPAGTAKVEYAFGDEPFVVAAPRADSAQPDDPFSTGFGFTHRLSDTTVRLRYLAADGKPLATAAFEFRDTGRRAADARRRAFVERQSAAVVAIRLDFRFPLPGGGRDPTGVGLKLRSFGLNDEAIGRLTAPAVVCLPYVPTLDFKTPLVRGDPPDRALWNEVKSVDLGTAPGRLTRTVAVDAARARRSHPSIATSEVFFDVLPVDVESVYVRYAFRDGTVGDEIKVPMIVVRP